MGRLESIDGKLEVMALAAMLRTSTMCFWILSIWRFSELMVASLRCGEFPWAGWKCKSHTIVAWTFANWKRICTNAVNGRSGSMGAMTSSGTSQIGMVTGRPRLMARPLSKT